MKLKNLKFTNKTLYWGLIITFSILYFLVGVVSTIHAFSFFQLTNSVFLALCLSIGFELGQSSVLFSLLTTKNKDKFLPWLLMFLLTGVQITGNVFASFRHLSTSGSNDWVFWQKTLLFGMEAPNAEMFQVIISYIQGGILPAVALGMVALIVQNVKHFSDETKPDVPSLSSDDGDFSSLDLTYEEPDKLSNKIKDFEKASDDLDDIDETGIGGTPTPEQEKQVSDFISDSLDKIYLNKKQKEDNYVIDDYLDKEAESLTPELEEQKQDLLEEIEMLDEASLTDLNETEKIEENSIKKRGRPPKVKEKVAVPKKDQGLLQKEENVSVPQKELRSRTINPLKRKGTTTVVKDLKEIIKPSRGEEVIKLLESIEKPKDVGNSKEDKTIEETTSNASPEQSKTSYIDEKGVEVIDVKAVPLEEPEKTKKN